MTDVVAEETPVRLHNGEIVIVAPYSNRDMLTVFKTFQKKKLATLVEAIPKDLDAKLYKAAYAEAVEISKNFDISNFEEMLSFADYEVFSTVIMLAIGKNYKGDVGKKADEILDCQEDFEALIEAIFGGEKKEDEEMLPPEKVQP